MASGIPPKVGKDVDLVGAAPKAGGGTLALAVPPKEKLDDASLVVLVVGADPPKLKISDPPEVVAAVGAPAPPNEKLFDGLESVLPNWNDEDEADDPCLEMATVEAVEA